MREKEKITLFTLGGLLTTLAVYLTVRLGISNAAFAVVPGWHTTIYPPEITWIILTILILVTSLLVYLIFQLAIKCLTSLWTKFKP